MYVYILVEEYMMEYQNGFIDRNQIICMHCCIVNKNINICIKSLQYSFSQNIFITKGLITIHTYGVTRNRLLG